MDCERTVNCPYNVSHQISEERLQYHLVKCRRNHPWKENIHIFQVTKKATILESELDCEWNKVGGLIPPNHVTLPPLDEDWNEEYAPSPLQTLDASDKPVFRNLPGATKSERKIFRREERCRFEKVIETMKHSEKPESSKRSGKRSKQSRKETTVRAVETPRPVASDENLPDAPWKSVKSRSRKRGGGKKKSSPIAEEPNPLPEEAKEEMTATENVETEEVEERTDENIGELRVAFHDMNVANAAPSGVGAEDPEEPGSLVPDFQPSGDLKCSKNSVFQDWDKVLIHDLPTMECSKDDIFTPMTSFADVLSKNSSSEKAGQENVEKSGTPLEGTTSSSIAVNREHSAFSIPSSITKHPTPTDLRRRSPNSTTRDKAPTEAKTYENYTNLNSILGRTSRKCDPRIFPVESANPPTAANARRELIGRKPTILHAVYAAAPVAEPNPDSFFCSRSHEFSPTFSYASILSKKPCSQA